MVRNLDSQLLPDMRRCHVILNLKMGGVKMRNKATWMVFLLLFVSLPFSVHAQTVGHFTYLQGNVSISDESGKSKPVTLGDKVTIGDIVVTEATSKAEITFDDKNIIRLAEKTRLKIKSYLMRGPRSDQILKLYVGKVQSIVKTVFSRKIENKEGRYEVHTPSAICGVRGTVFYTYHINKISGTTFTKGFGYFYAHNAPDRLKMIKAGQSATVSNAYDSPRIKPTNPETIHRLKKECLPPGKTSQKEKRSKVHSARASKNKSWKHTLASLFNSKSHNETTNPGNKKHALTGYGRVGINDGKENNGNSNGNGGGNDGGNAGGNGNGNGNGGGNGNGNGGGK
jgi:hypothetical protein